MPEAEPDPVYIRFYFWIGLALCIPAAIVFIVFGTAALEVNAFRAALPCPVGTQNPASSCLSSFEGTVTEQIPQYRAPEKLTISVGQATVHVGWSCLDLPNNVCNTTTFPPGTHVTTQWWKGRVVALGLSGSQPSVITDQNPEYAASTRAPFLILAVLALVPILLAGLLRQAPLSVNKLIDSFFTLGPEQPAPVSRSTIFRVALGAWGWSGFLIWFLLYFLYFFFFLARSSRYTLDAPLAWLGAAVIGFAIAGTIAYLYLARLVHTSKREAVVVQRVKRIKSKRTGGGTRVWYGLPDGTAASTYLNGEWGHLGHKGLHIDALTDPSTGKVRRVLGKASTQP